MFEEITQGVEELKNRWWFYLACYFAITSLIGFVLKFLFRNTNRIILYVMFYPAILTWKLIRKLMRK